MDLDLVKERIFAMPGVSSFTELADVINNVADREGASWDYCFYGCGSVGGKPADALPAAAANLCLLLSIHLVDDMLDHDPKGLYHRLGAGTAANLALAFQALASRLILESELEGYSKMAAIESVSRMMLNTSIAQQQDVNNNITLETDYWDLIRKKSPPLFSSALFTGALYSGCNIGTASQISRLGSSFGQMIQISDDISDLFKDFVTADWKGKGNNLALIFCQEATYEKKEEFNSLLPVIDDPGMLSRAQRILIESGALSYCVYHLLAIHQQLKKDIDTLAITEKKKLIELADDLVSPVAGLIKNIGVANFDEFVKMDLPVFKK